MTRERPADTPADRPRHIGHTVRELAALAGVSVRTLHHYDAIGLLRPARVGGNGYRYYGRAQLLRLQQILLHRRVGLSLAAIGALLDAPDFDQIATLDRQRARLAAERDQLTAMIATLEHTMSSLKGDITMTDEDLYSGFIAPERQAAYEAWIAERHGAEGEAWVAEARARPKAPAEAVAREMAALKVIETALADQMRRGVAADSPVLDDDLARHRDWVAASWGRGCPPMAYANLADMYEHPDFRARYDAIAPGLADWLPQAMRAWASRQGDGG